MDHYEVYRSQVHDHSRYVTPPEQRRTESRASLAIFAAFVVGIAPFLADATAFNVSLDMRYPVFSVLFGAALASPWVAGLLCGWANARRARDTGAAVGTARRVGFASGFWFGVILLWAAVPYAIGAMITKGLSGIPG